VTKNHEPSSARIEKPWKLVEGLTFEKSAWPLEKKQEEEEAYEAVRVQREKYAQQVCRTSSGTGVLDASMATIGVNKAKILIQSILSFLLLGGR
jgi:hypothetical protein